jgi:hypothetical protein
MSLNQDTKAVEMTTATIAGDLIGMLVGELKLLPDIWPKIGPDEQDDIIERVRNRVTDSVRQAVHLIASEGRITVVGDLKKVTFGDKVDAVFALSKNDPAVRDLTTAQGQACIIVVAAASNHMGGAGDEVATRQTSLITDDDDAANQIINLGNNRTRRTMTTTTTTKGPRHDERNGYVDHRNQSGERVGSVRRYVYRHYENDGHPEQPHYRRVDSRV